MKISYDWIREYVNTKMRPQNLRDLLTIAGHEITAAEERNNDIIFEIEVTPNRADCLCHIGMAREVAAVTGKSLRLPVVNIKEKKSKQRVKVLVEDSAACPRYSARFIRNVRVAPSPKWLARRIESIGLRPVNNIVDITNFVLFETGHPLHAFDFNQVSGNAIIVRRAKTGEKLITIDAVERTLQPHMLIIADNEKPIAVAGVMGSKNSEVTESTCDILLESAYFDPVVVRRTALGLGISSDSSYRFERGINIETVANASDRAAELICTIAKGEPCGMIDIGIKNKPPKIIMLDAPKVCRLLGMELKPAQIKLLLERLKFSVKGSSVLEVAVPSFRNDVAREADLVEEIARLYGYDKIPSIAPHIITTADDGPHTSQVQKTKTAEEVLRALGFNETLTYSLVSRQLSSLVGISQDGIIEIENPLSREQEIMRRSLIPGALKTIAYNLGRQATDVKIFELSGIYFQKEGSFNEERFLAIAQYEKSAKRKKSDSLSEPLLQLKGAIITLAERLGIKKLNFEASIHPSFSEGETLAVLAGNAMLGTVGKIKHEILDAFDIKGEVVLAELNFASMMIISSLEKYYTALPKFPYSYRDISFSIDAGVGYKDIAHEIRSAGGPLIKSIEILSEYHGEQIEKGQHGLAVRIIYQSKDRTLTEEEVSSLDKNIRDSLIANFKACLR